jgi:subtilisin family serine protease
MKKLLTIVFGFCIYSAHSQPNGWQNLDLHKDSVYGISTEKAYLELLSNNKKYRTVIVGVIDGGVDTAHEDLKSVIWTNPQEIPGNGIDDEHDGYIDDVHGWDFIGGPKGDIDKENLELTREIRRLKPLYGDAAAVTDSAGYSQFQVMLKEYDQALKKVEDIVTNIRAFQSILDSIKVKMRKDSPTLADFQSYEPRNTYESRVKDVLIEALTDNPDFGEFERNEIGDVLKHFQDELDYDYNLDFNPRPGIVGDDPKNPEERFYGNNDVTGPEAEHGTHVAGIIGAVRNNNIGINGVADHVWIMSVRTVPSGDERDKDIANAIRYAADHGAKVVNMSFGKGYSPDKKVVDEAVKYAMSKDVLLVHAAGNDGKNLDKEKNFPTRVYADGSGSAGAWIEVGASGFKDDSTLVAAFSNYGRTSVDVFAPGVHIHSTIPGSKYADYDGTSMASPVVAGLAALIREYYPKLTALQVKDIIMRSVDKPNHLVSVQENGLSNSVLFSDVCISGGIVNAYNALKLAEHYKK